MSALHLPFWRETPPQREEKREMVFRRFCEDVVGFVGMAHVVNFTFTDPVRRAGLLAAAVGAAVLNGVNRMLYGDAAERGCVLTGVAGMGLRFHTALHEVGHAAMAHLLFQKVRTQVTVSLGTVRGVTDVWMEGVRQLPFALSTERRLGLFNAAGPLTSLAVASVERLFAERLEGRSPGWAATLRMGARLEFALNALYALSTLWSHKSMGHDFLGIWRRLQIHPLAAAAGIAAIALMVEGLCYFFKSRSNASSERILTPSLRALSSLLPGFSPRRR